MLACTSLTTGCAESDQLLSRRTTIGTLKASVSHLEYERAELTREADKLKSENRRITERLAQEESANGELSARLDDARLLLRNRGYDTGTLAAPSRPLSEPEDSSRTSPAGRTQRPGRKPPFARIPGRVEPTAPDKADDDDELDSPPRSRDDLWPQSRRDDGSSWRRVARASWDVR